MDYLAHLGLHTMDGAVKDLIPGAVVAHEARFHSPARYNDILNLHVRIARIGRTSYTFHFLATNKRSRDLVASGLTTLVWLNDAFEPVVVPDTFREVVRSFEGGHLGDDGASATPAP